MNFEGNNNQDGLTIAQATSFMTVWGRINHGDRALLVTLFRGLVHVGGDIPARNQHFHFIALLLHGANDSVEHSAAVNNFMNVLRSLPLRSYAFICDLAEGRPIPRNDPEDEEQEEEPQEVQGPVIVSDSDSSND